MKTDRRNFLLVSSSACLLTQNIRPSLAQKRQPAIASKTFSPEGRKIAVYTTAEKTDYRITATDSLTFKPLGQPLETQICVFVDPTKTFQTHLGSGGAITDAAAETFAKLPKAQQQEILHAYYDAEKGIGYTLARTNIHSCDFSSSSYTYVRRRRCRTKIKTLHRSLVWIKPERGSREELPKSCVPPLMSPPTRLALFRSNSAGGITWRASTRSWKTGAKRSI